MPKKTNSNAPRPTSDASETPAPPKKRASAAKTPSRKTASKKKAAGATAPKPAAPQPSKAPAYEPSDAEIRLRAYFIAERRIRMGIPGDSADDWIDAKRQLIEEASGRPGGGTGTI